MAWQKKNLKINGKALNLDFVETDTAAAFWAIREGKMPAWTAPNNGCGNHPPPIAIPRLAPILRLDFGGEFLDQEFGKTVQNSKRENLGV